jgi:hypothetical protein
MIRKHRKIVNGVEITLLEKSVSTSPIQSSAKLYAEAERNLKTYIDDTILQLSFRQPIDNSQDAQTVSKKIQSESLLLDFLGLVSNAPDDGSILTYDNQNETLLWLQSPSIRLTEIENRMVQNSVEFITDNTNTSKVQIPFAVKWSVPPYHEWGGAGKAGIFWADPWADTVDNFSIKMGTDDVRINESGYTYGTVGGLAMKFSNDTTVDVANGYGSVGGSRGWVWSRGINILPAMALDSKDGHLTVFGDINTDTGRLLSGGTDIATMFGAGGGSSTLEDLTDTNIPSPNNLDSLVYNLGTGKWVASAVSGGGGGGSLPGVEVDMGSFLNDEPAEIDAGSFI